MNDADASAGLRQLVLDLGADAIDRPLRAALFEVGLDHGAVTVACIADGTTSLYSSTGGARLGLGGFEAVRTAAATYLETVEGEVWAFQDVDAVPLPGSGQVQMVAVTSGGLKMIRVPIGMARNPEFQGHRLWVTGDQVVTQIRLAETPESPTSLGA